MQLGMLNSLFPEMWTSLWHVRRVCVIMSTLRLLKQKDKQQISVQVCSYGITINNTQTVCEKTFHK